MGLTYLFGIFFGVFFTVLGLSVYLNHKSYEGMLKEIASSHSLQLIFGIIPLMIGAIVVPLHNIWVSDVRVIITLLGYVFLFSGVYRLVFTKHWLTCISGLKKKLPLKTMGFLHILLGLILLYVTLG